MGHHHDHDHDHRHHDQVEVRDREECGSYTEGMSGTDSYEGQVHIFKLIDHHDVNEDTNDELIK